MTGPVRKCRGCTCVGEDHCAIYHVDYCSKCFEERRMELEVLGIKLIAQPTPGHYTTDKDAQLEDSDVTKYGYYELLDFGRSADPQFVYQIEGRGPEFRLSFKSIPEDVRVWLAQVLRRQLYAAYKHGRASKVEEVQYHVEKLLAVVGLGDWM